MTRKVRQNTVKAAAPVEPQQNLLTVEEKQLIRNRIKQFPGEFEILSNELQFVSYHYLAWYKESDEKNEPLLGELYVYRDNRWKDDNEHFNNQAIYFRSNYDGRLWRLPKIKRVQKLINALKKDVRIRHTELQFAD
jgi:hypothetical protein